MLLKIFGGRKLAPRTPVPAEKARSSATLKIIHAGGLVELYYMAVPAGRIIDKYPSFTLARPDVFRRPWDAVVSREEILIPGQKYFLVPPRTVKKLKRRIKKPRGFDSNLLCNLESSVDGSSAEMRSEEEERFSRSSSFFQNRFRILIQSKNKTKSRNRRVGFFGRDTMQDSVSVSAEHGTNAADTNSKKGIILQPGREKKKVKLIVQWQPSLTSINEDNCS